MGLLFWPLRERTWQKWFSTPSWFTRSGFIIDDGNWAVFIATIDRNPTHIDCTSNHSFVETNWWLLLAVSSLHSFMKEWKRSISFKRPSDMEFITSFPLKSLISFDVWGRRLTVPSRYEPSLPWLVRSSLYFCSSSKENVINKTSGVVRVSLNLLNISSQ